MGKSPPTTQTVTQKTEIDPIQKSFLFGTPLPVGFKQALEERNRRVTGLAPLQPAQETEQIGETPQERMDRLLGRNRAPEDRGPSHSATSRSNVGFQSLGDMIDGGGPGASTIGGRDYQGPNPGSRRAGNDGPNGGFGSFFAQGGIVGLPMGGMSAPMMGGRMPDLSNREQAYLMGAQALQGAMQPQQRMMGYAMGGYVEGPGTGRSDSIPATIYQNGVPVQDAALSDGEFVMTERAVRGAGGGDREAGAARMYEMMRRFESGGKVG